MRSQFPYGLWHKEFIQKTRSLAKHKRTAALIHPIRPHHDWA